MWAWVFVGVTALWSVGNLVVAFVEPPRALAWMFPRRVAAFFAFVPSPFDRILGFSFNALAGFFLIYLLVRHQLPW